MVRLIPWLALTWLWPISRVYAEPPLRPALHWSRAPEAAGCIDPRTLALRVIALTGPVLVAASEADISIEGHISRTDDGSSVARITATGRDGIARGARKLEQQGDCRDLDQALAFVIALLIDPDLVLTTLPASLVALGAEGPLPEATLLKELEENPPRPAPVSPQPRVASSQTLEPTLAHPPPRRFQLTAGPTLALRELPRTALGLGLAIGALARPWLLFELSLRSALMLGSHPLSQIGHRVGAQSFGGSALVCPRYARANIFMNVCAGAEIALVRARGLGFTDEQVGHVAAFGAQLGAGVGMRVHGPWFVELRGLARFLFNRPRFSYSAPELEGRAFVVGARSGLLNLSLGYRI